MDSLDHWHQLIHIIRINALIIIPLHKTELSIFICIVKYSPLSPSRSSAIADIAKAEVYIIGKPLSYLTEIIECELSLFSIFKDLDHWNNYSPMAIIKFVIELSNMAYPECTFINSFVK